MPLHDAFKRLRETLLKGASCDGKADQEPDADGVFRAGDWQPASDRRRVEIMITGDPSRVKDVAGAVDKLQEQIFHGSLGPGKVEIRLTGFLDGKCTHTSGWSDTPQNAASQARRWQCYESRTQFAEAFARSSTDMVDAIVIVGHKFDDNMREALRQADVLKKQGVRIFCFHVGDDPKSLAAFEQLSARTNGVCLQLTDKSSVEHVMPVLMAHLRGDDQMLAALAPNHPDAVRLLHMLPSKDPV